MKRIFFVAIFLSLIALSLLTIFNWQKGETYDTVKLPTVTVRNQTFTVEIADDAQERSTGLSNRTSLDNMRGMLFVFEQSGLHAFWMKDTLIPLDMIFINNNRIITIHKNVQPEPNTPDHMLRKYPPGKPAKYVLEINAGLSKEYEFQEGDVVEIKN